MKSGKHKHCKEEAQNLLYEIDGLKAVIRRHSEYDNGIRSQLEHAKNRLWELQQELEYERRHKEEIFQRLIEAEKSKETGEIVE